MDHVNTSEGQYVIFEINSHLCAISIKDVVEINKIQAITEVPGTDPFITGMINLRGNIIPVINIRKRYHLIEIPFDKKSRIIIVNDDGDSIGIIVDEVKMVSYIKKDEIEPPIDMFNSFEKNNFYGFAKMKDSIIGILNIKKVLYPNDINEEVRDIV